MLRLLPLLLCCSLFGQTLKLYNDSAFDLHATIYAYDGTKLETLNLGPQVTVIWELGYAGFERSPSMTTTPFSVSFFCETGELYGAWTAVPTGALVNASGSPVGPKGCKIKKPKKDEPNKNTRPFIEY
ncbi:MAG: hypothetical protein ACOYK9_04700 [Chlamydiia bacterium]